MPAKIAPTISAQTRRSVGEATRSLSASAVVVPMNAPTLMKPAWPSDSSPSTPTVRFSEIAITT